MRRRLDGPYVQGMLQVITICKRALQAAAATMVGLVVLLAVSGMVLAGPTVWSQ
jgi:hypothetical protein